MGYVDTSHPSMGQAKKHRAVLFTFDGGVDYSTDELLMEQGKSPLVKNMWLEKGVLTAAPMLSKEAVIEFDSASDIHSSYSFAGHTVIHAGSSLYVCGKTGTAQNPQGADHSTFISFAPRNNPKIAIAVYVEHAGFGSDMAVPIASLIEEQYLTDTIMRRDVLSYVKRTKIDYPMYKKKN